jgi:hypothetical protein
VKSPSKDTVKGTMSSSLGGEISQIMQVSFRASRLGSASPTALGLGVQAM